MPLLVAEQRTEAWHAARKGKITASLAAACLGLDPYISRQKAFRIITGTEPETPASDDMRRGIDCEADAVYAWECATGHIAQPTGFWIHPELTWLGASPDGLIGRDGVLDVKCPRTVPNSIPTHHQVQIVVQLLVTGRTDGHYAAWSADRLYVDRCYPTTPENARKVIELLTEFYEKYIVTNTQPERAKRKK